MIPPGIELWTRQFGSGSTVGNGIVVDGSGVYVAGYVRFALPGQTHAGSFDAYVRKYDFHGNEAWTHQFGTLGTDQALGITVDSNSIYVVGKTRFSLSGQPNAGNEDAFVRKLDLNGSELWTRQFGTAGDDLARLCRLTHREFYGAGYISGCLARSNASGHF